MRYVLLLTITLMFSGSACVVTAADPIAASEVTGQRGLLRATATPTPNPPSTGQNALTIAMVRTDGQAATGCTIDVLPWMPAHGHGATATPLFEEEVGGIYLVSNINYTMPGHWELRVDAHCQGVTDHLVVSYEVQ